MKEVQVVLQKLQFQCSFHFPLSNSYQELYMNQDRDLHNSQRERERQQFGPSCPSHPFHEGRSRAESDGRAMVLCGKRRRECGNAKVKWNNPYLLGAWSPSLMDINRSYISIHGGPGLAPGLEAVVTIAK